MSPYYRKEGGSWIPLELIPPDIHVGRGGNDIASVFLNPDDKEQITIYLSGRIIVRDEDGGIIFPRQKNRDGSSILINRRDVIFENVVTGDRAVIIHSEKPIGKGK